MTSPNSLVSSFSYNPNNALGNRARRLASITHLRAGAQQAQHLYGYDGAGRITSWERRSNGQNTRKSTYAYNLGDELIESEERDLTTNALLDRETWGLDDGGNWLSHSRSTGNLMETRSIDTMNRLTRTGGAGSTVVEGQVNELSTVSVNGQPAEMRADPVAVGRDRPSFVTQGTSAGFPLRPEGVAVAAELLFAEGPGANDQAGREIANPGAQLRGLAETSSPFSSMSGAPSSTSHSRSCSRASELEMPA